VGKIAILCVPGCSQTVNTLTYFQKNGVPISLVLTETAIRKKYSATELQMQAAHQEYRKAISHAPQNGANGRKSFPKALWLSLPVGVRERVKDMMPGVAANREPVAKLARELNVPVVYVEKHSSEDAKRTLEQFDISYALLGSSNWLIKEPLLSMPNTKVINAHCAKLPRHRSLDSLPWSVMEGDQVGLTTHFVDAGIDTGPILKFLEVKPEPGDTLVTLRQRVNDKTPELFLSSVRGLTEKTIVPTPQSETDGIHHKPMTVDQLLEAERILQQTISTRGGDVATQAQQGT
jgi:folate-dependent phosphoribosylglycinamide formyltransferase PurN